MKKLLFILSLVIWITPSEGQNNITIENRSYPCSETYVLKDKVENSYCGLEIVFAKGTISEMIIFKHKEPFSCLSIKKKATIYLDDGTTITLSFNGVQDYVDNTAITGYYLESSEIEKLKKSNINYIRYSVKGITCGGREQEGDFTASNTTEKKIDFSSIISIFFKN